MTAGESARRNPAELWQSEIDAIRSFTRQFVTSGGDIHFDCSAPRAIRFSYLQQAPGSAAFVVIIADTEETSITLHGQPPGLHRFKAIASNSRGEGPESAIVEITVAAQQVA